MPFLNSARRSVFARITLYIAVVTFLGVAGQSASAAQSASHSTPESTRLKLQPCHVPDVKEELRCGTYTVPENRAIHGGRMLPLRVVVLPARAEQPAKEPIFYFEGGPGEAATESASYLMDSGLRETRDIVLVDQRGTGEGNRLDCPKPGSDADIQGYLQPLYVIHGCAAELSKHADLTQYATPTAMQDIDEIRQALGYDKILVYGGSYGARAAMIYIRMFGQHVQAGIIESIPPLAIRLPLYFARDSERAMESVFAECAAQPACKADYPDPKGDLEAVRAKLRQQPAHIKIKHPVTGAPTEIVVTERIFTDALHGKQYSLKDTRDIPLILRRAREGDFTQLIEDFVALRRAQAGVIRFGMFMAVVCTEDVGRIRPEEADRESQRSYYGPGMVRDVMASCSEWPRAKLPQNYFSPFHSNVPVLMISGDLDPSTPPVWGEEARRSFPNSLHVVLHDAHTGGSECANSLERQFLAHPSLKNLDTSCSKARQSLPFALVSSASGK